MIAVCENLYRSYRHVVVFNNKLARTHKHVTRPHLALCAPYGCRATPYAHKRRSHHKSGQPRRAAASPAHVHAHRSAHDRRPARGEARRPKERARERPDGGARARRTKPPAAMPSTRPLRATAAARRWPRRAAAEPPACRGSVLHAWACASLRRTSTGAWSASRLGVDASIEKAGDRRARVEGGAAGRCTHRRNVLRARIG